MPAKAKRRTSSEAMNFAGAAASAAKQAAASTSKTAADLARVIGQMAPMFVQHALALCAESCESSYGSHIAVSIAEHAASSRTQPICLNPCF